MHEILIRNSGTQELRKKYGAKERGFDPVILSPMQCKEADITFIHHLIS
jgi:hypothetical protein